MRHLHFEHVLKSQKLLLKNNHTRMLIIIRLPRADPRGEKSMARSAITL
jgi:hypothetical protein